MFLIKSATRIHGWFQPVHVPGRSPNYGLKRSLRLLFRSRDHLEPLCVMSRYFLYQLMRITFGGQSVSSDLINGLQKREFSQDFSQTIGMQVEDLNSLP